MPMRHRCTQTSEPGREGSLLARVFLLLVLAIAFLPSGHANAHGTGTPAPSDGELLLGAPEKISVELPGEDVVEIELRRADGTVIPFTGEVTRSPGIVVARPPVLEHGTYVIEWRSAAGDGWSTFSIGKPDASIASNGRDARPAGLLVAGIMALLLALAAAARSGRRAGGTASSVTSRTQVVLWVFAGVLLTGSALLLSPPTGVVGAAVFLAVLVGGTGALLLLAGLTGTVTSERQRTATRIGICGAALLPVLVSAGIVRNTLANPFAPASLLALAAALVLLGVALPLAVTALLARREVGKGTARAAIIATTAAVVITAASAALPVAPRVETVTGETRPAATCLAGANRLQIQRCLDASLVATARDKGVIEALDTLKRLLGSESRTRYFCHEASHAIGRESLRQNGNLADAFRDGYDVCDFGYYHGIVEGAAGGFDDTTFLVKIPTLCEEFASAEELFYMQCNHGIGHAAARRTNNDMLRSLEFCDALAQNPNLTGERLRIAQNGCGTGVTMEWFATATADPNAAVTPKVSRPRDVCVNVPARWAPECIEYVGNTLDASSPVESLIELGAWCGTTEYIEPCYRGLARAAAGVGIPARDAIGVCEKAGSRGARDECVRFYIAAVATTIDFDVASVDRICRELPEADRSGPTSLCAKVRAAVIEVLGAGDGKTQP